MQCSSTITNKYTIWRCTPCTVFTCKNAALHAILAKHQQDWKVQGFLVGCVKSSNTTKPQRFLMQKIHQQVFPWLHLGDDSGGGFCSKPFLPIVCYLMSSQTSSFSEGTRTRSTLKGQLLGGWRHQFALPFCYNCSRNVIGTIRFPVPKTNWWALLAFG